MRSRVSEHEWHVMLAHARCGCTTVHAGFRVSEGRHPVSLAHSSLGCRAGSACQAKALEHGELHTVVPTQPGNTLSVGLPWLGPRVASCGSPSRPARGSSARASSAQACHLAILVGRIGTQGCLHAEARALTRDTRASPNTWLRRCRCCRRRCGEGCLLSRQAFPPQEVQRLGPRARPGERRCSRVGWCEPSCGVP